MKNATWSGGVIHSDIHRGNVLVMSVDPFVVKLTDFGLSKMILSNQQHIQYDRDPTLYVFSSLSFFSSISCIVSISDTHTHIHTHTHTDTNHMELQRQQVRNKCQKELMCIVLE